ncbi:hypothetical protein [Amycolatopsis taiwanensis]|uniref:Uncharacterized protein n=1 Tax=Amycolatopsis taiwanensis TaxID=342230 RepID=A0A9W6VCQ0_9PSEU|nr:hypothetical protein [Amycolatopsis taiwanensis]GLY63980.1 hypothetical protein Atai01_05990 [Amycolatopsis taiwanensis]
MTSQWDTRRAGASPSGVPMVPQPPIGIGSAERDLGSQPQGRPVARVDFFRRMPTGGSTAYVKPTQD